MDRTDEELMIAYVDGESAAFDELFRRYAPMLLRMLARQLPSADARDVLQQTFLQLHRSRNDYRPEAALRPWVFTIALNLRRQHFRRARREVLDSEGSDLEPADVTLPPRTIELTREVRDALAALPAEQQEVILLHWMDGLPFQDVADLVGASLSAVKVRAHRGYAAMRKLLTEELENDS